MATSTLGFGVSKFGVSDFGYGSPATATPSAGSALKGADGNQYGSRQISTSTATRGQYVVDANGRYVGMPDASQLVLLAMKTVRNSSAVKDFGQNFTKIQKISDNFLSDVTARVQEALADLITKGMVRLDSVVLQGSNTSQAAIKINITDLTTKKPLSYSLNGDRQP